MYYVNSAKQMLQLCCRFLWAAGRNTKCALEINKAYDDNDEEKMPILTTFK